MRLLRAAQHRTSLFIVGSSTYAQLLIVICMVAALSEVVTHNVPFLYFEVSILSIFSPSHFSRGNQIAGLSLSRFSFPFFFSHSWNNQLRQQNKYFFSSDSFGRALHFISDKL